MYADDDDGSIWLSDHSPPLDTGQVDHVRPLPGCQNTSRTGGLDRTQRGDETRHRRILEQQGQRHPPVDVLFHPVGHLGRRQRTATQFEEAVVHADRLESEHVGEDLCHGRLETASGGDVFAGGRDLDGRQRAPVDLAGAGHRELVEHLDGVRDEMRRQMGDRVIDDLLGGGTTPRHARHIGDQDRVAGRRRHTHTHRVPDVGMGDENGVDLPRLDPHAADLDLEVVATVIDQFPCRGPRDEIAGAVHPGAGPERVGDEPACSESRTSVVAASECTPCEIQFAHDTGRHRAQPRVENPCPDSGDRPADGHRRRRAQRRGQGHPDRGLGGAVQVEQGPAVGVPPRDEFRRAVLPRHHHRLDAGDLRRVDSGERRRRGAGVRDPVPGDDVGEFGTGEYIGRTDHQFRTRTDRQDDLPDRDVETRCGEL